MLLGGTDRDRDVFVFESLATSSRTAGTADSIQHFIRGIDRIDLSQIDAVSGTRVNDSFAFTGTVATAHSVWYATTAQGDLLLQLDVNGDTRADMMIALRDLSSLRAADILL